MRIAHFTFDFGSRHERGDGVHHNHVDRPAPDKRLGNFQRLFAGIGLRHEQIVHLHTQLLRIGQIQRMLRIDKGRSAAGLLGLRNHMKRQGRLA